MTFYQWVTVGAIVAGFIGTWLIGAFTLGRAVEQMKASFKKDIADERKEISASIDKHRDSVFSKIDELEEKFNEEQRSQDHNFGEVGAAVRQYIADVEKKVREVEIYGRDNYVKIPDFEKAIDKISETIKDAVSEIKKDIRQMVKPPAN